MRFELPTKPVLILAAARSVGDLALQAAEQHGVTSITIAIVDHGGALVLLLRQDQSPPGCVDIGIGKARTAALFRQPTKAFKDRLEGGAQWVGVVPGIFPMSGGFPLQFAGHVVGGIGVAGATGALDDEIAQFATSALLDPGH